ncbi:Ig-like domain-containing protein [Glaesserella sp.]|uniref:Ig-like domain-containing protein n=1 Tax=Glaesserella sp. TaxID=2094731 RepID=UPI0035A17D89
MKGITLKVVSGENVKTMSLQGGKTIVQKAMSATKYQLVDENGQLITHIKTKVVGDDLQVFVDGEEQPSLVLEEYQQHYPIQNEQYLAEAQASFATAESAVMAAELAAAAPTNLTSVLSASKLTGIALGALATTGLVAAVVRNQGGKDDGKTESPVNSAAPKTDPSAPQTPTTESKTEPSAPQTPMAESKTEPSAPQTPTTESKTEPSAPQTPTTESKNEPSAPQTPSTEPVTPVEPLKPEITLDPIAADDLIDHIEAQADTIMVTGSVKNANNGDTVTLMVGDAEITGSVQDGRFAIAVETKTLVVHQLVMATIAETDTVLREYRIQTPELSFDPITPDNVINIAESTGEVTLSGSVTNAPDGSTVKIAIGDEILTAQVNAGLFTLSASGQLLAKNRKLDVSVETPNKVGSEVVIHSYDVDLEAPTPTINLNPIAGDNRITTKESQNEFTTITGTVEGVEDGQEVKVSCGCASCSGVQWIDMMAIVRNGEFKVDFKTADLLTANYNTVKASVTAKDAADNSTTVEDSETYSQPVAMTTEAVLGSATVLNRLSNLNGDNNNINKAFADATPVINYTNVVRNLKMDELERVVIELNNGKTYTLEQPKPWFTVAIPVHDLAGGNQLKVTATVKNPTTMETLDLTRQINYVYDVTADIQVTIDPINDNKTIAFADLGKTTKLSGTLNYDEYDIPERSVNMVLTVGGQTYTPLVMGKTWSVEVPLSVLAKAEGENSLSVNVTATDKMANIATATATAAYQVDTKAPQVTITLEPITVDNAISQDERTGNITLKGKVTGEFIAGETVRLFVNGETIAVNVTADGTFSHDVAAQTLANDPTMSVRASYTTQDAAGNRVVAEDSRSYSVKTGNIDIQLDSITADDLINVTEKSSHIMVSGTVSGTDAREGQQVTLTINGTSRTTAVQNAGGQLVFKLDVPAAELISTDKYVITASILGENGASANTARSYTVDKNVVAKIDITQVGDFSQNLSEIDPLVRIKGAVEFADNDIYSQGLNHKRLLEVQVKFGEKTYKAGFRDKQFFMDIAASELAELTGQPVSLSFSLATGVNGDYHHNVYGLNTKPDGTYSTWRTFGARAPQVKAITFESPYLEKQADNSYKVNYQADQQVTVSGTVSAADNHSVKVGETIVIKVGDKSYETQVQTGNVFSTLVDKSVLAQADHVTATLTTNDLSGNAIQVSDIERVIAPQAVSGKHVIVQSQPPAQADINNDHSTEGYNFPYFVEKLGGIRSAINTVLGGESAPLVYKYHIVTKEELADPANIESSREVNAKYSDYVAPEDFHPNFISDFREAYAEIGKYINVNFVEVNSVAEADTNIYIAKADNLRGHAAWAWSGGNIIWNGGVAYTYPTIKYSFYTALHEIGHTLGMAHSSNGFKNTFRAKEDTLELTNMSYNNGVKDNLFYNLKTLRMFDIAYLQYQFGVNKTARAGNDVYSFKAYNAFSPDGDIYIWDGAGVDTFDASKEEQGVTIDLTPGSWIHVGDTREQTLVIKEQKTYTAQEYFGLSGDTAVGSVNNWGKLGSTTFNEYTKGQAFIGFGTQLENLIGSAYADKLTGNVADNNIYGGAGDDVIDGGAGNDHLDGGEGTDRLIGGLGNDTYVVENVIDTIIENEDEGIDSVFSNIDFSLADLENVEHLTLVGSTAQVATGNSLNNTLTANNLGNTLNGGGGDDRLVGGLGADILNGGEGADTFVFNTVLNGNVDRIDLQAGDKVELSREIFTALSDQESVLNFIKYDAETGKLYYDSDNEGSTDRVHFATVNNPIAGLDQNYFIVA